ncbi:MAG: hypothetical protein PXY39_04230 [archaeon]|nr:hypothetical protein [archaeon]
MIWQWNDPACAIETECGVFGIFARPIDPTSRATTNDQQTIGHGSRGKVEIETVYTGFKTAHFSPNVGVWGMNIGLTAKNCKIQSHTRQR